LGSWERSTPEAHGAERETGGERRRRWRKEEEEGKTIYKETGLNIGSAERAWTGMG